MRVTPVIAVAMVLALNGCRSGRRAEAPAPSPASPVVARVAPGDVLTGDLKQGQACQCFYFEGVEYGLLDLGFAVDCAGGPPPTLAVTDPEGRPFDLSAWTVKDGTSITARGLILRRTGTYKGTVCKAPCAMPQTYRVSYDLRLAGEDDKRLFLSPTSDEKVSFLATRGSNVVISVRPEHSCCLVPKVVKVKGPDGLRALAPENQLEGAPAPRVEPNREMRTLRFHASQAGRYTVHLAAEDGCEGHAIAHVAVFPARSCRTLHHDGADCAAPAAPGGCGPACQPPPIATASLRR